MVDVPPVIADTWRLIAKLIVLGASTVFVVLVAIVVVIVVTIVIVAVVVLTITLVTLYRADLGEVPLKRRPDGGDEIRASEKRSTDKKSDDPPHVHFLCSTDADNNALASERVNVSPLSRRCVSLYASRGGCVRWRRVGRVCCRVDA
jgi:hypothetical protein